MNQKYKDDLLTLLKNPLTGGDFRFLSPEELQGLNERIHAGTIFDNAGKKVIHHLEDGLFDTRHRQCARIVSGVVCLLPSQLLCLTENVSSGHQETGNEFIKKGVGNFYDSFGWKKTPEGMYVDGSRFDDNRPFVQEYKSRCNRRVMDHIHPEGKYLLDAGSGPLQHKDYLEYSKGYFYRVCVDLSMTALIDASKRLGDRGIYIQGDLTRLPIRERVIDSAVSINVLYHIPRAEQPEVVKEMHRVLRREGKAVVVYSNGRRSILMNFLTLPLKLAIKFKSLLRQFDLGAKRTDPELYYYVHPLRIFDKAGPGFEIEIRVWRSVSVPAMKWYFHRRMFGRRLLRIVYRMEQNHPAIMGRIGEYPMLVFEKK